MNAVNANIINFKKKHTENTIEMICEFVVVIVDDTHVSGEFAASKNYKNYFSFNMKMKM